MAVTTNESPALTAYPGWSSTRERGRPARTLFLQTASHARPLPCKAHQTRLYGVLFHRAGLCAGGTPALPGGLSAGETPALPGGAFFTSRNASTARRVREIGAVHQVANEA